MTAITPKWLAPCGHEGTPIIGTFVNCNAKGCDGASSHAPASPGLRCIRCGRLTKKRFCADWPNCGAWL